MGWKNLLESISELANDQMRLRNEYLVAENRILRNQIDGRVQLTDSERKELAEIGAKLGKTTLAEIAAVAQPDTILAWNRKFANEKMVTSEPPKSVGRPRVDKEIKELVLRMARENRSWGYDRIQGGLNHLGYTISDITVGNILKRHGIPPAPERKKSVTWREFIRSHWDVLVATRFFNSEVWSWFGLSISYLLTILHFSCHQVHSMMMTLYHRMLAMQGLVRRPLDLSLSMQRWTTLVTERTRAKQAGVTVLEQTEFEMTFAQGRPLRSQDNAKVIPLSATRPKPIRDGPTQRQQRFKNLSKYHQRKAA